MEGSLGDLSFLNLSPAALKRFEEHSSKKSSRISKPILIQNENAPEVSNLTGLLETLDSPKQQKKESLSSINSVHLPTESNQSVSDITLLSLGINQYLLTLESQPVMSALDQLTTMPCFSDSKNHIKQFNFVIHLPNIFMKHISLHLLSKSFRNDGRKVELLPMTSEGKSGATFFATKDKQIILKSINKHERNVLIALCKTKEFHSNNLLPKIFGIFCFLRGSVSSGQETNFVAMNNVFYDTQLDSIQKIKEVYDLKGSISKRITPLSQVDPTRDSLAVPVLKDLNLGCKFKFKHLEELKLFFHEVSAALQLLKSINVMDYSLLLGVKKKANPSSETYLRSCIRSFSTNEQIEAKALLKRAYSLKNSPNLILPNFPVTCNFLYSREGERSRTSKSFLRSTCHIYNFSISCSEKTWRIERRFHQFEQLEQGLNTEIKATGIDSAYLPQLPAKSDFFFMRSDFVKTREKKLLDWLRTILEYFDNEPLCSTSLTDFLTHNGEISNELTQTTLPRLKKSGYEATRIVNNNEIENVTLYVGIIDILQKYNFRKRLESAYKSMYHPQDHISSVDHNAYADRFLQYLREYVFL